MTVRMPYFRQMSVAAFMLAKLTGCPPMRLVPASRRKKGTLAGVSFRMQASRASRSMSPLKGRSLRGARPSAFTSSSTRPPRRVIWALAVVKW